MPSEMQNHLVEKYGELMSLIELARVLRTSPQTVRAQLKFKKLPFRAVPFGRHGSGVKYQFSSLEVGAFIDGNDEPGGE